MRRFGPVLTLIVLLPVAAWCAAGSTSLPTFWRYAHPEAKALVGIEWSRILSSPFGEQIRRQMKEAGVRVPGGLDVLEQIDRVFVSSPGKHGGGSEEPPPAVIAVQGRFDLAQLRKMALAERAVSRRYKSVEMLSSRKGEGSPMTLALVDAQTILLGDPKSVVAAIDQRAAENPPGAVAGLYRRAVNLAESRDIWVVALASPAELAGRSMAQAPFLADIDSLEAGISFRNGLDVEMSLGSKSQESAQTLAGGLQMMLAMALSAQKDRPGVAALSRNLRISSEGTLVKVALAVDQAELEKGLNQIRASMTAPRQESVDVRPALRSHGAWTPHAEPPPEEPPKKKVVRIYGLEDGPREVPFR